MRRSRAQITNWHLAHLTNGPAEAANNLIKRVKVGGFGFSNFRHYRGQGPALRRPTQLGPTPHRHPPLKSEERKCHARSLTQTIGQSQVRFDFLRLDSSHRAVPPTMQTFVSI
jgi:hypothetical protein